MSLTVQDEGATLILHIFQFFIICELPKLLVLLDSQVYAANEGMEEKILGERLLNDICCPLQSFELKNPRYRS